MEYAAEPTLKPFPGFSAEKDAEILRKAMKGIGTNEDAITHVLGERTAAQRVEIARAFKTMYGKDLIDDLKSEVSGSYQNICTWLCLPPADFDAHALHRAMKGAGTDDRGLIEILCTRTNAQITAFKEAYKRLYHKNLEDDIISETSGHFQRLLVSLLTANRDENPHPDPAKVQTDAQSLYDAGEQKFGTDESKFNQILALRSFPHLRAVFQEYHKIARKDIEDSLKSEMTGDLLEGMLAVVRCVKYKPDFFAKALYKSMKGAGTDEDSLIRIIVTRSEIDMVQIKQVFQAEYKQPLAQFIKGDTRGDFEKILLTLIGEGKK